MIRLKQKRSDGKHGIHIDQDSKKPPKGHKPDPTVVRALQWPSDEQKQKLVLNAAIDRSVWEVSATALNFLAKLEEKYGKAWTPTEISKYKALMKSSSYLFRASTESDSGFSRPTILDGIISQDPRITNNVEYQATQTADYNVIFK